MSPRAPEVSDTGKQKELKDPELGRGGEEKTGETDRFTCFVMQCRAQQLQQLCAGKLAKSCVCVYAVHYSHNSATNVLRYYQTIEFAAKSSRLAFSGANTGTGTDSGSAPQHNSDTNEIILEQNNNFQWNRHSKVRAAAILTLY